MYEYLLILSIDQYIAWLLKDDDDGIQVTRIHSSGEQNETYFRLTSTFANGIPQWRFDRRIAGTQAALIAQSNTVFNHVCRRSEQRVSAGPKVAQQVPQERAT